VSSEVATALTLSILVFWDFTLFGGEFNILQRFDSAAQPACTIHEDENPQSTTRFLNGRKHYS